MYYKKIMVENEKKKEIRDKALELFRKNGYDAVTLIDICKASNISKNTFYYYFDSKEEIIRDLFSPPISLSDEILIEMMGLSDPYEQLLFCYKKITERYVYIGKEIVRQAMMINFTNATAKENEKNHPNDLLRSMLQTVFERAQAENKIRTDILAKELVYSSTTVFAGCVQIWATVPFEIDLENYFMEQFKILVMPNKK